jgi:hypothetical protein
MILHDLIVKLKSSLEKLKDHQTFLGALWIGWGVYFFVLFKNIIDFRSDGIYFGHVNVWSDWALHTAIANSFAFKAPSLWFAYHPIFADGIFTYPFLADMITGFLMRVGFGLKLAYLVPSMVTILLLVSGIYFLAFLISKNKIVSFLSVNIFLFSAGLGFINYLKDVFSDPVWSTILYPIKDYSALFRYDWYAGNVVVGLLLPQRAFLLGITLGIWSLIGLIYVLKKKNQARSDHIIIFIAGLFAGILPIVHPHSLISLVVIAGIVCIVNYKKWRYIIGYVLPAGLLSSFLFFYFIYGGIENTNFFSLFIGWGTKSFGEWLWMWFLFWGLSIPLAVYGFWLIRKEGDRTIKYFFLSFFVLFVIGNLFLFQPIKWDNSKIFWWVYLGFSILVAISIYRVWLFNKYWGRAISVLLFLIVCLTGVIELNRLIQIDKHSHLGTSKDDMELGLVLRKNTDELARFLTNPSHNHFIMVWALRPIFMGYSAWVYNYGFNNREYEKDLKAMYAGGSDAEALLKKHRISYVVIGRAEIRDQKANEVFYRDNFPVAFENKENRVYDTRELMRF